MEILSVLTLDQLNQRLSETLDALHALHTGARVIDARFGDRVVRYQEADIPRLEAYAARLQRAISIKSGSKSRPIYFQP